MISSVSWLPLKNGALKPRELCEALIRLSCFRTWSSRLQNVIYFPFGRLPGSLVQTFLNYGLRELYADKQAYSRLKTSAIFIAASQKEGLSLEHNIKRAFSGQNLLVIIKGRAIYLMANPENIITLSQVAVSMVLEAETARGRSRWLQVF